MQRAFAVQRVQAGRPTLVSVRPRRNVSMIVTRGAPEKGQIDQAVKEAEEACAGGDQGEWYVCSYCMNSIGGNGGRWLMWDGRRVGG